MKNLFELWRPINVPRMKTKSREQVLRKLNYFVNKFLLPSSLYEFFDDKIVFGFCSLFNVIMNGAQRGVGLFRRFWEATRRKTEYLFTHKLNVSRKFQIEIEKIQSFKVRKCILISNNKSNGFDSHKIDYANPLFRTIPSLKKKKGKNMKFCSHVRRETRITSRKRLINC